MISTFQNVMNTFLLVNTYHAYNNTMLGLISYDSSYLFLSLFELLM